ncbi:MAG: hypothetical protein BGO11_05885 [Solirubrobacterales bacterium 70-9]|nr:MAG: hypothetical protein BGO11_05885 [Solirubrobacterales bacterium 70-9]
MRTAEASSVPAGCVSGLQAQGPWVTALDGAAATAGQGWVFSTPGSAERRVGPQPVGFGDVVRLRFGPTALPGALYTTPTSVDFGGATVETEATRTFTVAAAFEPVRVDSIAIAGSPALAVGGDECSGRTIAVGTGCTVTVRYAPHAAGSDRATLTVNAAGASEPATTVALAGTAVGAAKPSFKARRGTVKVGRKGIAVIATLVCPVGPPCKVKAPKRVTLKTIGARHAGRPSSRHRAAVLAPTRIAPGTSARLRLRLPRRALVAVRRHPARVVLKLRLTSSAGATSRNLRVRLRG